MSGFFRRGQISTSYISREVQRDYLDQVDQDKQQKMEELTEIFHQLDKDGDGCLSLEEIQEADDLADGLLKKATVNAVDATDLFHVRFFFVENKRPSKSQLKSLPVSDSMTCRKSSG